LISDSLKILLVALGGAVLALLLVAVFSSGGVGGMGSMTSGGAMGTGMFGVLFVLLFWVLVTALIVALPAWIVGRTRQR